MSVSQKFQINSEHISAPKGGEKYCFSVRGEPTDNIDLSLFYSEQGTQTHHTSFSTVTLTHIFSSFIFGKI